MESNEKFVPLNKIDERRAFYEHWGFFLAIALPLTIALLSFLALSRQVEFDPILNQKSFDIFLNNYRFSFLAASIAILTGVFFSRMHSSKQRAAAISQVAINNNFKMYFDHRQVFEKDFGAESIKAKNASKFSLKELPQNNSDIQFSLRSDSEELYHFLFPENTPVNFNASIPDDVIMSIISSFENILEDKETLENTGVSGISAIIIKQIPPIVIHMAGNVVSSAPPNSQLMQVKENVVMAGLGFLLWRIKGYYTGLVDLYPYFDVISKRK